METRPTFIDRDLLQPAFIRDLQAFLSLSEDTLLAIAEARRRVGSDPGYHQAAILRDQFDIPIRDASAHFRIANHLVRISQMANLAPDEAARQVAAAASAIDDPIQVSDRQVDAIASILSSGRRETPTPAPVRALGPRFLSADGSWMVRLDRTDDGAAVPVPWVNFSLSWSDRVGARREIFLQMSEAEWESFQSIVVGIGNARGDLASFIETLPSPSSEEAE